MKQISETSLNWSIFFNDGLFCCCVWQTFHTLEDALFGFDLVSVLCLWIAFRLLSSIYVLIFLCLNGYFSVFTIYVNWCLYHILDVHSFSVSVVLRSIRFLFHSFIVDWKRSSRLSSKVSIWKQLTRTVQSHASIDVLPKLYNRKMSFGE